METTMLALVLCLVMPYFPAESLTFPLSRMDQSVDDMYFGCSQTMAERVQSTYFPTEINGNQLFRGAWQNKENTAQKKYDKSNKILTKEQIQALYVYTGQSPNVFEPFNAAVRNSATSYTTNAFSYHSLHYWLTTALQTLKANTCRTTYKRSKHTFTGTVNQEMRFGYFASSSPSPSKTQFGIITCFQIETCFGASIRDYSLYSSEDEVLIPPYETFKITHIAQNTYGRLRNCRKIFVLKSTGTRTNLNCNATRDPSSRTRSNSV